MDEIEIRWMQGGQPVRVTRFRCERAEMLEDGELTLPPLARLSVEDQMFVTAFVRVHGNIKKMEKLFAVSYPTIKNRLNAIAARLDADFKAPPDDQSDVLDQLARGEISVTEAMDLLDRM